MYNPDISIIIVDDLQFSRIVVKTALKKSGYHNVRLADSAASALEMLENEPADVVLADWVMPEMDGLELTTLIRQRDEKKGVYTSVILFTANEGVDSLVKAFSHGIDDYLNKPPNPYELTARVNSAARIASMQNDLLETSRQISTTVKRLEEASLTDTLTGVGNEKLLRNQLDCQMRDTASRSCGVSLLLIQIDQYDEVINTYGTEASTELLKSFTTRLQRTIRPTDILTRLEDSRFGIVMRHTIAENYRATAMDRIASRISQHPLIIPTAELSITATIGVCFYSGGDTMNTVDEMITCATEKLSTALEQNQNAALSPD